MTLLIKDISCTIKTVPLKRPFITALHEVDSIQAVQVKVLLSDETIGIGAATPNEKVTGDNLQTTQEVISSVIRPALINEDFLNWNQLIFKLKKCIVHNPAAKAAVEIALYQAKANENKQFLVNLLGADPGKVSTDYTISIGSDEQMVSEAQNLVKQGFTSLKIKLGTHSIYEDINTVEKIAQAVGPNVSLRIDCNQGWNKKQTLLASSKWSEKQLNIDFIEQPIKKDLIWDLAYLTQHSLIPIMVDESVESFEDAIKIINAHACDYINIKLMKTGGLSDAVKINDLAHACGIKTMVGCMIEPVESIAAAVAFAVANKNVAFVDLDSIFMAVKDPDLDKYLKISGNQISLKQENE